MCESKGNFIAMSTICDSAMNMSIPHLNFKYTSTPDADAWEGGGEDISKRMVHILQQATGLPLVTKYITTYNTEIYKFFQVLVAMLLLPI